MAAVLPETDGESNSGELRTAATVGSGGVVLPARTHTVNYGSRNNKHVRVRGDLQGAVCGGGWRRGARERKEGGETNPATDAAMAGGGEVKWRLGACTREQGGGRVGCGAGKTGTQNEAAWGPLNSPAREKRKKRKKILNRIGPQLDSVSEIGPDFRTVFRRFTKTSESFAYELRFEQFSRLRVRIVEGNNLQSKFERKLEPTGVVVASPSKAPRRKLEAKQKRVLTMAFRRTFLLDDFAWKSMMQ